jgi:hypothetical protein
MAESGRVTGISGLNASHGDAAAFSGEGVVLSRSLNTTAPAMTEERRVAKFKKGQA